MKFSLLFVVAACAAANCTNGDRHSLAAMDVDDIGKMANDCGSEAYGMLTGVFDKEKFNSCFMKKVSISESCSDCYATSGEYGAKNCKAACLLGWCKQGCLDCTAPATKKVAECVGDEVHFKQVAPCLEAGLLQAHPLVNPESGKCLDIYNPDGLAPSQLEDETPVNIFRCNGAKGQQWLLQDGQLVNPASGKCLDIYNPSELSPDQLQDETKVQLVQCKGNPNQQWALVNRGIGHKNLVNIPSGKCLDIYSPSGNLDDDTQVQLFTCDGDKGNQKWRFDFLVASSQLDVFYPTQRWSHHSDSTLSTDGQLCLDWTSKDGHSVYVSSCDSEHLPHHKWTLSSDGKLSTDEAGSLVLDWTSRVGSDGYHAVYMNEADASLPHQRWRLSTDGALTAEGGAGLCLGWLPDGAVRMMPCQGLTSTAHGACEDNCMAQRGYDYPTCRSMCLGAADAAGPLASTAHGACEDNCMAQRGYDYPTCRSMCLGAADAAGPLEAREHNDWWKGHDHHDHHDNWHHHDHDNWWHGGNDNWWHGNNDHHHHHHDHHDNWWHGNNDHHHHHHDHHDWRHDHAVAAEVMV